MIQAQLVLSLDGKLGSEHKRETCKRGDVWYIFEVGPNFRSTWKVICFDDNGLRWLLAHCREVVKL